MQVSIQLRMSDNDPELSKNEAKHAEGVGRIRQACLILWPIFTPPVPDQQPSHMTVNDCTSDLTHAPINAPVRVLYTFIKKGHTPARLVNDSHLHDDGGTNLNDDCLRMLTVSSVR